jgi:uncharacterized membrane protein YeaQ/YmgE (transglycosylase-associated protein family)
MSALQWIQLLLLGGIAGAIGQIVRVTVGMKKLGQEAAAINKAPSDLIEVSRLVMSIVIGLTAGALAAMMADVDQQNIDVKQLLAFAAAGYAGADFIEGAMAGLKPAVPSAEPPAQREVEARPPAVASLQPPVVTANGSQADHDDYLG